jgi:hypothetical protein
MFLNRIGLTKHSVPNSNASVKTRLEILPSISFRPPFTVLIVFLQALVQRNRGWGGWA